MKRKRTQSAERRHMIFRDQHGRKYSTQIELMTGDPCSPFMPMFGAPIMPPEAYLEVDPDGAKSVRINYRKWFLDAKAAWKLRYQDVLRFARELHGKSGHLVSAVADKKAMLENPPPDIEFRIGAPPTALELILACQQGNPWALGFDPRPDSRLEPLLEQSARDDFDFGISRMNFGELVTDEAEPEEARHAGDFTFDSIDLASEVLDEDAAVPDVVDGDEELEGIDDDLSAPSDPLTGDDDEDGDGELVGVGKGPKLRKGVVQRRRK